ncbi:LysR family transcriptional regulator [Kitasatospora sp. HPMI-4]|uniref:LysR family transcriptional regulator n=1 Tax=Kitasatospora sp. HPMI-4 TaxID=3448443 RepID=UPI003F1982DC
MELRQLRYFQAVAEEGNLTRAAQRLYLSGPTLSQQIRLLEKELGAALFERGAGGMALTQAGLALLPEAKAALDAVERARRAVESATRTEPVVLRVGVPAGVPAALVRCVREAGAALRQAGSGELPPVRIRFLDASTAEQLDRLADGDLDLGLLTAPFPTAGLRTLTVWQEPMGVVMDRLHPLARLDAVGFGDLEGQELIWFPREFAPGHHDEVLAVCRRGGWDPRLRPGSGRRSVFQTQLTCGEPVVAVQAASTAADDPALVWRPFVRDAPSLTLAAAWRAANTDPVLLELVAALRRHRSAPGRALGAAPDERAYPAGGRP